MVGEDLIFVRVFPIVKLVYEMEIDASRIVVSPRPVWKCRTCTFYGKRPSCPPLVPSWREAREWVKSYKRALLLKFEVDMENFEDEKRDVLNYILNRERELFSRYPYVFALFPGACNLCRECEYERSGICPRIQDVRPSLDAIGVEITSVVRINFGENALYSLIFLD